MTKQKTCGKCEHYTPDEYKVGFGDCGLTGYVNDGMPDNTRAYAWDYEGYNAGVYVGEKFGCIYWLKKQTNTQE